ncbi:MAG: YicC/YloC family endoribonuclease [Stagnimonas sp.]|nr:YicC/YloC family endoribonuclease [Stagnimonas sp.]
MSAGMVRSMTGFARVERIAPGAKLAWELRAVNSRFLDLTLKLPEEFRVLESELRQRTQAKVSRGKLEVSLRYTLDGAAQSALHVDLTRLAALNTALDQVNAALGATATPDPVRVLSFPGVLQQQAFDFAALHAEALSAFDAALVEFNKAREREGQRTGEYLLERAASLEGFAAQVKARAPLVRDAWMDKLRAKVADLGIEVEPQRLAQEAAMAAQRLDVDEELSRLASHLVELRKALAGKESVGRRLDFLMQEFNREVNTTGSKSQDAEMTNYVVEMKVLIEQMREQIANLE